MVEFSRQLAIAYTSPIAVCPDVKRNFIPPSMEGITQSVIVLYFSYRGRRFESYYLSFHLEIENGLNRTTILITKK